MHHAAHVIVPVVLFFALFLALLLSFLAYLVPTFVAFLRGHKHRVLIAVLNVLFGWSLVGWLICLIWAFAPRKHSVCRCGSGERCDYDCD
jgi:cytochrome c biogenesis factor